MTAPDLRALAEAAKKTDRYFGVKWFQPGESVDIVDTTDAAAYIAAASPDVILALLDEIEAHRQTAHLSDPGGRHVGAGRPL